jgi:branched-chain amino acid transport system substrate-binding protein
MKNKASAKTFVIFAIIALMVITLTWVLVINNRTTGSVVSNNEPIKIGIILPLSGDLASLGQGVKNGAMLGYEDLTKSQKEKIELLFEDDQFNPKNIVTAFNKLVDINRVNVVICLASTSCNAVAPLAEEARIPLIAVASDPKIQKGKEFVVRLEIAPAQEAKTISSYVKEKDYKRIASVVALQDGIQAGYSQLSRDPIYSSNEVSSEFVNPDEKDFRTVLIKVLEKNPDVIFVGLLPGQAGEFGKQAKELGYKGEFIGLNFLEGEETLTEAQGSLEGLVYTNAKDPQNWFSEEYKKEYEKSPGPGSAHIYDSVKLISNSIESGKTSNIEIAQYLSSIRNYSGALGTFSSTGSHEFTIPVELKTIRNNEFVRYEN